jgi:hypothetical protein
VPPESEGQVDSRRRPGGAPQWRPEELRSGARPRSRSVHLDEQDARPGVDPSQGGGVHYARNGRKVGVITPDLEIHDGRNRDT